MVSMTGNDSFRWGANLLFMAELRKRLLTYRDIMDLPHCHGSGPIDELVMTTIEDLHNLYPNVVHSNLTSESEETSLNQALFQLFNALKSIGDFWAKNHKWIVDLGADTNDSMKSVTLQQLSQRVLDRLNHMINIAKKMFDVMEEDGRNNEGSIQDSTVGDTLSKSYSNKKNTCPSPDTPASFSPEHAFTAELGEFGRACYSSPVLLNLRLQAVKKLAPIQMKYFPFNKSPPTSPEGCRPKEVITEMVGETVATMVEAYSKSPAKVSYGGSNDYKETENWHKIQDPDSKAMPQAKGSAAAPTLPPPPATPNPSLPPTIALPPANVPSSKTAALSPSPPPPPSEGLMHVPQTPIPLAKGAAPPPPPLGMTKALRPKKSTKLKRSSHMGNLYRLLKVKLEGSSVKSKPSRGRKTSTEGSAGAAQGMADALAEMTKNKHAQSIMEIKAALSSFKTKDMDELLKFQKYVEQHLEKLTDETQVLAKFEGFPTNKLETLRAAAALHTKLEEIATNLKNWKPVPPLHQHLAKVEAYFNKFKGEIDALERSKEEQSKKFQQHDIHFDFNVLERIKESMVDVSSSCMELAIKERRAAKAVESVKGEQKTTGQPKACAKVLWRAFQLAYRVYSFAGGQDDRADMLTKKLAQELEAGHQLD